MIKRFMLLAVMAVMTFVGHSQTSKDSTIIPNSQLRLALQLVEKGKQCEDELTLQRKKNDLLYDRISLKDSTIYSYSLSLQAQDKLIESYRYSENNLLEQKKNYESAIKNLNKSLKKQKTKTFLTSLVGIIGIAGAVLIFK